MAKISSSFSGFTSLGSTSAQLIFKNFPFVLFLGFLTILYIANAHYAEKKVRQIQSLQKEIKDYSRQCNELSAAIMYESKLSQIGENVKDMGLRKTARGLKKVVVE
ncbi:MAG: cell division protein FtsL [Paraglaciecola sp.]|jgi:cell division protein FtsL